MKNISCSIEIFNLFKEKFIEHSKRRAYSIGASEISYVVGASKYKTPIDLYFEKIALQEEKFEKIIDQINDNTIMGILIEQSIIDIFCFQKNLSILKRNEMYQSHRYPNVHSTIDALCVDSESKKNILVEIKNTNRFDIEEPDVEHYIQVLSQLSILKENNIQVDEAYIVYMLSFNKIKSFSVKYSETIANVLLSKAQNFYVNYIEKRKIPTDIATPRDIYSYFGTGDDIMDIDREEDLELINRYYKVSDELKKKEKELEEIKDRIYNIAFDRDKGIIKKEFYLGIEKVLSISTVKARYLNESALMENLSKIMSQKEAMKIIEESKQEKIYNRINKSKEYEKKLEKN